MRETEKAIQKLTEQLTEVIAGSQILDGDSSSQPAPLAALNSSSLHQNHTITVATPYWSVQM
jgi:hypothetical protein